MAIDQSVSPVRAITNRGAATRSRVASPASADPARRATTPPLSTRTAAARTPRRRAADVWLAGVGVVLAVAVPATAAAARPADFGEPTMADPCTAPPDPFPGDGLDAAAQRLVLTGLN
ncbi:MAG: hypothetical protein ACO26C_05605, partial [Ilumatobacteraceae bacterium]